MSVFIDRIVERAARITGYDEVDGGRRVLHDEPRIRLMGGREEFEPDWGLDDVVSAVEAAGFQRATIVTTQEAGEPGDRMYTEIVCWERGDILYQVSTAIDLSYLEFCAFDARTGEWIAELQQVGIIHFLFGPDEQLPAWTRRY